MYAGTGLYAPLHTLADSPGTNITIILFIIIIEEKYVYMQVSRENQQ